MNPVVRLAWRNAWRNWRRSLVALLAISLGVLLLLFVDGLIQGSDQAIFGNAVRLYGGNIMIHGPGYRQKASRLPLIPVADADQVVATARSLPHVRSAVRRISAPGVASSRRGSFAVVVTGIEASTEAPSSIIAERVSAGRFLVDQDGDAVLIGRGLAELLEIGVGDRLRLLVHGRNDRPRQRTMTVVGLYDLGLREAERSLVYVTLPEAQTLTRLRDQVSEVAVSLADMRYESQVLSLLRAALPKQEVDTWSTLRPEMRQTLEMKAAYSSFFGLVVVVIAAVGILNVLLMAVFERLREMGLLVALGLHQRQLWLLYLTEGGMLGAVGATIGCLAGAGLVAFMGRVGIAMPFSAGAGEMVALLGDRLYPYVSFPQILWRGLVAVVIATLAAAYPAWIASRRAPAAVLHHV